MTRDEAKTAGEARYLTGKPCRNGHVCERRTSTGKCVECHQANKKRYDCAHPDKKRVRMRKWQSENREKVRETNRRWAAENPQKCYERSASRRARKVGAAGHHTRADIDRLFVLQGGKCALLWCRKSISAKFHVDHILALAIGGSDSASNIQLLCPTCNWSKGAKHPIAFAQENGALL